MRTESLPADDNGADERRRRIRQGSAFLAIAAASVSMVASIGFFLLDGSPRLSGIQIQFYRDIETLKKEMIATKKKLGLMEDRLNALKDLPPKSKAAAEVVSLGGRLDETERRLQRLEAGLLASPESALSVPLLRRDIENLKLNIQRDSEISAKQLDRMYDQNKWFLGLMLTMAIGIIGLAVSNFVQLRRPADSGSSNN